MESDLIKKSTGKTLRKSKIKDLLSASKLHESFGKDCHTFTKLTPKSNKDPKSTKNQNMKNIQIPRDLQKGNVPKQISNKKK